MNILPKNNLYKADTDTKTISGKKDIFLEKLLFTMFYSPVYILNNFFTAFSAHWIALAGPQNLKITGISSP